MKKTIFATAAIAAMAVAGTLASSQIVSADSATGTSIAEFTVDAGSSTTDGGHHGTGDDADLILMKIPDLRFAKADGTNPKVADIMNGTTLNYVDGNTVKKSADAVRIDGADGIIEVQDYRGTNAGWNLSAKMDKPTYEGTVIDGTLNLKAAISKFTNVDAGGNLNASLVAGGDAAEIWAAKAADATASPAFAGEGAGVNDAEVSTDTTFVSQANPNAVKGQYDATITWTLAGTPSMN